MVDAIVREFEVPVEGEKGMRELSARLLREMETGLARDDHTGTVKMLITYVHDLPNGSEQGQFLALDLGGSNFRVLLVTVKDGQIYNIDQQTKVKIDDATKKADQEVLFGFIAQSLIDFIRQHNITKKLPLGFTFSFPVHQTSLVSGTLIHWTKNFDAKGAVDEDVVQLLMEALKKKGEVGAVDIVALVNDTTGTQLANGYSQQSCHVGLILGTGTNACYTERLANVPKFTGNRAKYEHVLINMEWGGFGSVGKDDDYSKSLLGPWLTRFDESMDKNPSVTNLKKQIYEKMISGKYLGELVRQCLLELIKAGVVFGGSCSEEFRKFEAFNGVYVTDFETGNEIDLAKCKAIFKDDLKMDASDEDCRVVRRLCEAVTTRAARLAGAGIVTVVKKIGKLSGCSVAVDGSLYTLHPNFKQRMADAMNELAPGNGIQMKISDDGSGRGAAMVAAVAVRLASS